MRFQDFKLTEASNLATAELVNPRYINTPNDRIPTFLNKIKSNSPFQLVGGGSVTIDPSEHDRAAEFLQPGARGSLKLKTTDGTVIPTSQLAKTQEFGGQSGGDKTQGIKFNRGEVAEGYHALAAFVRLIKRPSSNITLDEVVSYIPKLENNKPLELSAKEVENKELSDKFSVAIALKPGSWDAFQRPKEILADKEFLKIATDIIKDANADTGRRADVYAANNKFDHVRVIGDGVSGENETKTDIEFDNETETKRRGYSIKAGTVKQIHQVGGGKKTATAEEKFEILNKELFQVHGRATVADISSARDDYIRAMQEDPMEAQEVAYRAAVANINQNLQGDDEEKSYIKRLAVALKYWQVRDDDSIYLKQFTGRGTYILDAKRFDLLYEKGLDLVADYDDSKKRPEMYIKDVDSDKILIRIRTYVSGGYVRNYIEKGPLFVELTNIGKSDK